MLKNNLLGVILENTTISDLNLDILNDKLNLNNKYFTADVDIRVANVEEYMDIDYTDLDALLVVFRSFDNLSVDFLKKVKEIQIDSKLALCLDNNSNDDELDNHFINYDVEYITSNERLLDALSSVGWQSLQLKSDDRNKGDAEDTIQDTNEDSTNDSYESFDQLLSKLNYYKSQLSQIDNIEQRHEYASILAQDMASFIGDDDGADIDDLNL
ncbi:hypothetical protein WALSEDRAFT_59747 [Wallemia mellicola CBS 633.66]|uniref:Uncharacterized protein n=1 Tax=Wallemia mellicola (strain ATCC MYA-4683 / CBS 633.66) TaxID=671144 RepID=I4YGF4_WALMC|nr:hypothetical protein WALSEDRAFT_59747 [Wallemia mellicola CBS 633.66]EIM23046.1 hypothetical protein WALSEDRAFT_59747 [Wallemia mellicola CBS 633.66]|eukprot:XP_006957082.1 hypothetical protein WALSEDRAFT_59747 [Wallemia mellicola CBS 633.66]